MKRQMTLREWRRQLGEAISLADAAAAVGRSPLRLAQAAAAGKLRVCRFEAADGRVFHMVRVDDLLDYRRREAQAATDMPHSMQCSSAWAERTRPSWRESPHRPNIRFAVRDSASTSAARVSSCRKMRWRSRSTRPSSAVISASGTAPWGGMAGR